MTTATDSKPKKRTPKRLSVDELKEKVASRMKNEDYKGVDVKNVQWDTIEYDDNLRRQMVVINTVDENDKPDGNTRKVATSDLQHVKHTKELSDSIKRKRNNNKRSEKRKSK